VNVTNFTAQLATLTSTNACTISKQSKHSQKTFSNTAVASEYESTRQWTTLTDNCIPWAVRLS